MSDQQPTENTPLLDPEASTAVGNNNGVSNHARARAFRIATTASFATSILTLIFLSIIMILISNGPAEYNPPYGIYYSFAAIMGSVSICPTDRDPLRVCG
jgi:hypothetical protein